MAMLQQCINSPALSPTAYKCKQDIQWPHTSILLFEFFFCRKTIPGNYAPKFLKGTHVGLCKLQIKAFTVLLVLDLQLFQWIILFFITVLPVPLKIQHPPERSVNLYAKCPHPLSSAPLSSPAAQEAGIGHGSSAGALSGREGPGPCRGHSPPNSSWGHGRAAEQCLHSPKRRLEGFLRFRREGLGPSKYSL